MPIKLNIKPKAASTPAVESPTSQAVDATQASIPAVESHTAQAVDATQASLPVEAPQAKTARRKLVVEIDASIHKNLRRYALDQDKTLTDVVNELLKAGALAAGYK